MHLCPLARIPYNYDSQEDNLYEGKYTTSHGL